jgi:hypothetical protein
MARPERSGSPARVSALTRQRCPESGVDLLGGLPLHAKHDVRVGVECDPDGGVPEALAHDLGVNVACVCRRSWKRIFSFWYLLAVLTATWTQLRKRGIAEKKPLKRRQVEAWRFVNERRTNGLRACLWPNRQPRLRCRMSD